jgi:hypothetical protein
MVAESSSKMLASPSTSLLAVAQPNVPNSATESPATSGLRGLDWALILRILTTPMFDRCTSMTPNREPSIVIYIAGVVGGSQTRNVRGTGTLITSIHIVRPLGCGSHVFPCIIT